MSVTSLSISPSTDTYWSMPVPISWIQRSCLAARNASAEGRPTIDVGIGDFPQLIAATVYKHEFHTRKICPQLVDKLIGSFFLLAS